MNKGELESEVKRGEGGRGRGVEGERGGKEEEREKEGRRRGREGGMTRAEIAFVSKKIRAPLRLLQRLCCRGGDGGGGGREGGRRGKTLRRERG